MTGTFKHIWVAACVACLATMCHAEIKGWLFCKKRTTSFRTPIKPPPSPTTNPRVTLATRPPSVKQVKDLCCGGEEISTKSYSCCMGKRIRKDSKNGCCIPDGSCDCQPESAKMRQRKQNTSESQETMRELNQILRENLDRIYGQKESYQNFADALKNLRGLPQHDDINGDDIKEMHDVMTCFWENMKREKFKNFLNKIKNIADAKDFYDEVTTHESDHSECFQEKVANPGFGLVFGGNAVMEDEKTKVADRMKEANENAARTKSQICQIECMIQPLSNEILSLDHILQFIDKTLVQNDYQQIAELEYSLEDEGGSFNSQSFLLHALRQLGKQSNPSSDCNTDAWEEHVSRVQDYIKDATQLKAALESNDDSLKDICDKYWPKNPNPKACGLER